VILAALILLAVSVLLSAFFSGSETGFYRVGRMRLVLDALSGDWIARGLLALTNSPAVFVATVLVGNNVANYLSSLAVVIGVGVLLPASGPWAEIAAPIVLAPVLFVYGELLPKNLFYQAPNRLLRAAGIPLLISVVLFSPLALLLWLWSKLLELAGGESPEKVQLTLARKELQRVFDEGHEAGILRPAQRGLAQSLFSLADMNVTNFVISPGRMARVRKNLPPREIRRLARRQRTPVLPVEDEKTRELIGYYRVTDLYLCGDDGEVPLRPLVEIPDSSKFISALSRLEKSQELLGRIVDRDGGTVGFVTSRQLSDPLFRGR